MPSHPRSAWERLGKLLVRRRIELDPRYRNRSAFETERAPGLYRIINDIELGRRDNYEPGTIVALEAAYDIAPGSITRALDGDELESQPVTPPRPPLVRREVPFHAGTGSSEEDWQPYVTEIRQEAREVLVNLYGGDVPGPDDPRAETAIASLPGRLLFPGDNEESRLEAQTWDEPSLTAGEKTRIIAVGRWLRHRADERENRRTGLSHYPVSGVIPPPFSVAGRAIRASS